MSPDDRDEEEREPEHYDLEPPRSVFAALWFRVVLVVVVIGVTAAVAVPYVLEWMNPPPPRTTAAKPGMPAAKAPAAPAQVPGAPAPTAPAAVLPATQPPPPAMTAPARRETAPPRAPAPQIAAKPPAPAVEEKPAPAAKTPRKEPARRPAKAVAKAPAATGGAYFVQVGAFRDPDHAKKLAAKLRDDRFRVTESATGAGEDKGAAPAAPAPAAAGGDKYDVFVSGASVEDINAKLTAKGLATAPAANGVVVKPSLPLRDAVALSKDLAVEGLKVQVRRAAPAGAAPAPAPAAAAPVASGGGLHRVMVGPYPDRAAAAQALQALREKGYRDSFIARGGA